MGTTLAGNTQKTTEFVTEKKLTKNTRNNKVYAQPIQEIQGKPRFFDRSLKPGQTKKAAPRGDLCSGFEFIYDKGFGHPGPFLRPGGSKNTKNFESQAKQRCQSVTMKESHAFAPIFDFFVAHFGPQKRQKLGQTRTSKSEASHAEIGRAHV